MIIKVTISRNKLFCKSVYVVAYDEKRREKLTRGERMALIEIETATLGSLLVDAYICIRRANGSKKRKGKKKVSPILAQVLCIYRRREETQVALKKIVIVARQIVTVIVYPLLIDRYQSTEIRQ